MQLFRRDREVEPDGVRRQIPERDQYQVHDQNDRATMRIETLHWGLAHGGLLRVLHNACSSDRTCAAFITVWRPVRDTREGKARERMRPPRHSSLSFYVETEQHRSRRAMQTGRATGPRAPLRHR